MNRPLLRQRGGRVVLIALAVGVLAGFGNAKNIRSEHAVHSRDKPITVLSYNIRIGAGVREWNRSPYKLKDEITLDLKPVIAAIRSVDPDVVGLQEVLGKGQAKALGRALNMNYAYVPHGVDKYGYWWGVALLSKYKIDKAERHEISYGKGNTKSMLLATLDLGGRTATFVSIHKDRDLTDGSSFRVAMQRIGEIDGPVVLIGDLNMWPDDERHRILAPRFRDSAREADTQGAKFARQRGTWIGEDGDKYGKRIDYVLVDPNFWSVRDAGLLPENHWRASDHIGYFARLMPKF